MIEKLKSNKGITLIELLVASVIALIATGAALKVYINQQENWLIQEDITDMQQNGRAAIDEIAFHARQAGYRLPPGLDAIYASDANPDTVTFVYLKEPVCDCSLTDQMPNPSSEIKLSPDSIGCFVANTWAYIYDPSTQDGEFFLITLVQTSGHLQHNTMILSKAYPAGSQVYMIEVVTFYVDNTTDSLHPALMYQRFDQPYIYSDNIEDLEFTYRLSHGAIVDTLVASSVVREVNIELTARTERPDADILDDYMRDTFRTTVYLRNMDF